MSLLDQSAPQQTAEWHAARVGKVTASRIADALARTKAGWGASRANYAAQLVCERLTGEKSETYTNAAMQWGTDTEPHARAAYEFRTDNAVELAGFIDHPRIPMSGASPDGLVGADGLIEIKCPASSTHIETLLGATIPERYRLQMTFQLACTERRFCDFVSFDPRLPEHMRMYVERFEPSPASVRELEEEVRTFLAEIDDTIARLERAYGRQAA